MRVEYGECGLGTWFQLKLECLVVMFLGTAEHVMVCSDVSLSLLFGNVLLSNGQVMKLGLVVCEG